MKYRSGTVLLIIVFDDSASVSMPPSVTSAVRYPSDPFGVSGQAFNALQISIKRRVGLIGQIAAQCQVRGQILHQPCRQVVRQARL